MTEASVGRLLPACLHQAIADELPDRLEYYECWLHAEGLRDGSIGLAPLTAVLGFLRTEGDAYDRVMARAGQLAAEWTVATLTTMHRKTAAWWPRPIRVRLALRVVSNLVRSVSHASRASSRVRGDQAEVEVHGSLFCSVREAQSRALCAFYLAVTVHVCRAFGVTAAGQLGRCRASGGVTCAVIVHFSDAALVPDPAIAA